MSATSSAALAQVVLLVYLETVEWVDLFPWNNIRGGNGQDVLDIALGVLLAVLALGTLRGWRLAVFAARSVYPAWLALQIASWWVPYLFGPPAGPRFLRVFGPTVRVLPPIDDHPIPDADHLVLQLLIVIVLVAIWGVRSRRRST